MGTPATKKPMEKNGPADKQAPPDKRGEPVYQTTPDKQINRGKVESMDNTAVKTGMQETSGTNDHHQTFQTRWFEVKSKARSRWAQLNDEDINNIGGRYELLVEALQRRYGYEEAHAEREIDEFLKEH